MNCVLVTGLLVCLSLSTLHAAGQERARDDKSALQGVDKNNANAPNDQIEIKTDRFSNVTTVSLKPQTLVDKPDHFITIEINTKLGEKKYYSFEKDMIQAQVVFESQSKRPVDFGDEELHFIVDGQPMNLGKTDFTLIPAAPGKLKPDFRLFEFSVKILDRPNLERFSRAKHVEMRLGSIETTLSSQLVASLREYAIQTLTQNKTARERNR